MTRSVLLDNVTHRDLRIVTARGAAWGDDVMSAVVVPSEFRNLQAHYPVVFQKTADAAGFQPVAVFGFEPGQNLFLGPEGWDAPYVPMAIERQPFLIGRDGDERGSSCAERDAGRWDGHRDRCRGHHRDEGRQAHRDHRAHVRLRLHRL